MFQQIVEFLQNQLQTNHFFSGGFVLMVMGGLVAYCRNLPHKIWNWIETRVFIEFEIPMKDEAFAWFNDWLAKQTYSRKRARWLTVKTLWHDGTDPTIILSPAPGIHWLWWHKTLLIVRRERKETPAESLGVPISQETFVVKMLTRDRAKVEVLLRETYRATTRDDSDRINVNVVRWGDWYSQGKRRRRSIDSVILKDGLMEDLLADVQKFRESEQRYIDRGIPYRRGYLLYGPPGSGKSSTVTAIASHFKLDIYILNLSDPSMDDNRLQGLLASVNPNAILLIEDIDCAWKKRDSAEKSGVTFSGLLNAVDGVAASEGRIVFMTTNHVDTLDPALVRPGRCDKHVFVDNACPEQAERLFKRFFDDPVRAADFAKMKGDGSHSMAALQVHLLKYDDDPYAAAYAAIAT